MHERHERHTPTVCLLNQTLTQCNVYRHQMDSNRITKYCTTRIESMFRRRRRRSMMRVHAYVRAIVGLMRTFRFSTHAGNESATRTGCANAFFMCYLYQVCKFSRIFFPTTPNHS